VSIKSRQVAGVTSLVVFIVAALSAFHLASLARVALQDSAGRGEMLRQAIFQRAREVVPTAADPYAALEQDGGIRSLLESASAYSRDVTYAAIVNKDGIAVAHNFKTEEGTKLADQEDLTEVVKRNAISLLLAVDSDRTFEVRQPLLFGDQQFGSIRIGISTLLVKSELQQAFKFALSNIVLALIVSTVVAMLLAQWMLRPIHVIQSGLTRLGRGEFDVRLELPEGEEFKDLGSSFAAVSAQLSESRAKTSGQVTDFESVVDNLEDAVALYSPEGKQIFTNPAMEALLPELPPPVRALVDRTVASHQPQGPITDEPAQLLLMTHPIDDANGHFVGAMLVARNLGFMTQVQSTLNYSRKLAALNAMTIHLELLKNKLARVAEPVGVASALSGSSIPDRGPLITDNGLRTSDIGKHVDIISKEISRLDTVLNGFLKFARPDELRLQPLQLEAVVSDVVTTVTPEAERMRVVVRSECPRGLPEVNADAAMLRQALLNLALNACQAMPDGGILKISCRVTANKRVEMDVEDTGVGIPPEHLQKIFDLYFTTKERGSGIGLSMVYRIVQLHDGEIEVQSTPGAGTRFRLTLPQA
jgi:signal transduction histidine kinase